MMLVRHAMAVRPVTASPDMNAEDAAGLMVANDIGVVPVTDEDRLIGMVDGSRPRPSVSSRSGRIPDRSASVMSPRLAASRPSLPTCNCCDARALMAERGIRRLPVVKEGRLVGMLSLGDVALGSASMRGVGETLAAISASASTEEVDPGPEVGTPDRVKSTSGGFVGLPARRGAGAGRGPPPSGSRVTLPRCSPGASPRTAETSRDTCICEIPSSSAISVWVLPSKNRRYRILRSRSGRSRSAGRDAQPVLRDLEAPVLAADRFRGGRRGVAGRSVERVRRIRLQARRAPGGRRPLRCRPRVAISATVGALPRSCHIVETVRFTRIAVSWTFRGTRSAQPRSRK